MSLRRRKLNGASGLSERDAERLRQALTELADVQLALDAERLALHDVRSLFDQVLAAMTDALAIADPAGRIRQLNPAAERLLGVANSDALGQPLATIMSGSIPGSAWEVLQTAHRQDQGGVEARIQTHDGRDIPVSLSVSVIRDPHGKVAGVLYSARDLSDTERLLVAVGRAEERWRLLAAVGDSLAVAAGPDALRDTLALLHDPLGCSRSAAVLVDGCELTLIASRVGSELIAATELPETLQDRSALASAVHDVKTIIVDTGAQDYPVFGARSVMPEADEVIALVPLRSDGGAVGVLMMGWPSSRVIDPWIVELAEAVAERIGAAITTWRLRDALQQSSAAQAAARYRQMIAAALSHDMKTPLASLTGAVRALRAGALDSDRIPSLLEVLERQSLRLGRLVDHLLDFACLESGRRLEVSTRSLDVGEILWRVARNAERPIMVQCGSAPLLAFADADRLEQVIENLVANAIKFSPTGSPIELQAGRHADQVHIVVVDRGPGIPPAQQARLFEPFRRGDHPELTGTGLGLYLSRALTEAMGGRLELVTSSAAGTTIRIIVARLHPTGKQE